MSTVLSPPETTAKPSTGKAPRGRGGFAGWLNRWRLALRLGRRDARRAKGRTALVVLMVGLPVAAIVAGDTLYRTGSISAVESLDTRLGSADALVQGVARTPVYADPVEGFLYAVDGDPGRPWRAAEVRALLPAGSTVVSQQRGRIAYRTGNGYAAVEGAVDDLAAPIRDGAYDVVAGRVPTGVGEVAVSEAIAERGFGVGDRIELTRNDVPMTVVGVLAAMGQRQASYLVLPPASADLLETRGADFFVQVPGGLEWPAVQQLNADGLMVVSREVVLDPPPRSEYLPPGWGSDQLGRSGAEIAVIALLVAALLLQVVLLAGPAFAVGLRRSGRDLALLASSGATPADLRRTVLASGLVLGAGAAVLGALLGIGLAVAAIPLFEAYTSADFGPFEVAPLDALAVVGVGALAGLAAAWMPARQAARTDVVTTLTGRRGQVRTSWRLPVIGLVVAATGLVLTVLGARGAELAVAGGAVLLVVGVVLATAWLVGLLAPLARRLPVSGRLAVRDATRNRSRTAPAVAAVMATVAGVTTLAIGSASDSAQGKRDYWPSAPMGAASIALYDSDASAWDDVARVVRRELPGRPTVEIRTVRSDGDEIQRLGVRAPGCSGPVDECAWYPDGLAGFRSLYGEAVIMEPAAVVGMTSPGLRDDVEAALRSDRVLVFGSGALDAAANVTLQVTEFDPFRDREEMVGSVVLPGVEIAPSAADEALAAPAMIVVPPSLADRLPVETSPTGLLVGGPGAVVTEDEETRLREAVSALTPESSVYVERGWSDELWLARLLLVLVGGALVLVATLTATGLAVADARPDLATLAAIGAAPRTRRRMAMGSAAVIGGFGAALGVLAGLAPGIAVAYPLTSDDYGFGANPVIVVPWDLLAMVAVGVPLLAVLVTGVAVRSRLPMATRVAG